MYLAWGLQSDQHTGLQGGSDETEASSGHRPPPGVSPVLRVYRLYLTKNTQEDFVTVTCSFFFLRFSKSVGKRDCLLAPAHWGSAWLSLQSKASIFLLPEAGGKWARQRTELEAVHLGNGTSRPHLWDIWTVVLELLFLVCSLHSCLKCLIKLYKLKKKIK